MKSLIAALFLGALALPMHAMDVVFSTAQGTGSVDVDTTCDASDLGYGAYTYAPIGYITLLGVNFNNIAFLRAGVDRSYSTGYHYSGYFIGGSDIYASIY